MAQIKHLHSRLAGIVMETERSNHSSPRASPLNPGLANQRMHLVNAVQARSAALVDQFYWQERDVDIRTRV